MPEEIGTLVRKILSIEELPTQSDCIEVMRHFEAHGIGSWWKFCKRNRVYIVVHDVLVDGLYKVVSELSPRAIVEIGAGNGKLSYQLKQRGLEIIAVDDYGWEGIQKPEFVERLTHYEALQKYNPDLVIVCFPDERTTVPIDVLSHASIRCFIHLGNSERSEVWKREIGKMTRISSTWFEQIDTFPTFDDAGGCDRSNNILYQVK